MIEKPTPLKRSNVSDTARQKKWMKEADILLKVSKRISAQESLDDVLNVLVEMCTSELNAERGSLFLNDFETNELYSRVAQGTAQREIRILNSSGIAGFVYNSGESVIIDDPYGNPHFNRSVDEQTGFVTKNILCVPVRTVKGKIIGVAQVLNKITGHYNKNDLALFEAMTSQAALALESAQFIERMQAIRLQEMEFINVVSEVTADIKLGSLLQKVMGEATRLLNAERSTLFLHDEKNNDLWSEVGQGLEAMEIRLPSHLGIAGAVFTSEKTINIPYAYADLRFNPAFDKKTGFFTRSILCVPVVNKQGKTIGVTQVLNKRGGPFTSEDEARLRAFTAQVSIALENAKLFADVQNMKNYNEAMLESMSNGLITLDETGKIITCNAAGLRILQVTPTEILNQPTQTFFTGANAWITDKIKAVEEQQQQQIMIDAHIEVKAELLSVNLTVQPLLGSDKKRIGFMLVIEDISNEKRLKSTMSRYMDPSIADRLVASGSEILGGQSVVCTTLFSDVRGFTTLTEQLGAQGTVSLLNEYFTIMVDCIQREEGMLDKFIGDAIMAVFGIPVTHNDDEDRAVRTAIAMIRELQTWNTKRAEEGKMPLDIGIGLNTDTVVSGNIGSQKRMDFTIIGDGVNLAARLESACKQYGAHILISEFTYAKLKDTYRTREIDYVVVKGKTEPVAIYEILDYHNEQTFPNIVEVVSLFKNGLGKYRTRHWQQAISLFNEALVLNPADKVCKLYLERCYKLEGAMLEDDWDGVWVMESK
ncbi:MAG: GAF domain-containing protein [Planctomycetes bacterium]|nr:GAF domain-containing protein [Planctomycetota bacterium]